MTEPLPPPEQRRPIEIVTVRITGADGEPRFYWHGPAEALELNVPAGGRFERLASFADIPQIDSVLRTLPPEDPPP